MSKAKDFNTPSAPFITGQKCTGSQITSQGFSTVGGGCLAPSAMGAHPSNSAKIVVFSRAVCRLAAKAQGHTLLPFPPGSVGCITPPQCKAQVCKVLVIFGPRVSNNIPGPSANDGASAGAGWSWLAPAAQIRPSQSMGVSPGLAQYLSPDLLHQGSKSCCGGRQVLCPHGHALLFSLDYWCQEGRESSSLSPGPQGRGSGSASFQISPIWKDIPIIITHGTIDFYQVYRSSFQQPPPALFSFCNDLGLEF